MDTTEIIGQLRLNRDGVYPRKAVEAAVADRERIIPALLEALEEAARDAERLSKDYSHMLHFHAMYLLAQFRETRAYPLIFKIFTLPGSVVNDLAGEFAADGLHRVLASVCGGDTSLIEKLIEDEVADECARGSAVASLVALAVTGGVPRLRVGEYFRSLFDGKLAREPSHVWNSLVCNCADLFPGEMLDEIKKAYDDELVDPGFIRYEKLIGRTQQGEDILIAGLKTCDSWRLVDDAASEMEGWVCFDPESYAKRERTKKEVARKDVAPKKPYEPPPPVVPHRRPEAKIGRNDPCPCGSGRKYKKCCAA